MKKIMKIWSDSIRKLNSASNGSGIMWFWSKGGKIFLIFLGVKTLLKHTSDDVETHREASQSILEKSHFCHFSTFWTCQLFGAENRFLWAGSQFVRAPPILLQSGEPRTRKHCKNTYKMSGNFRSGARFRFYRPLIHRQNPYRMNLFGEQSDF